MVNNLRLRCIFFPSLDFGSVVLAKILMIHLKLVLAIILFWCQTLMDIAAAEPWNLCHGKQLYIRLLSGGLK